MKSLYGIILALAVSSAASQEPRDARVVQSDNLVANFNDSLRFECNLSLEDGLIALQDISFHNDREDIWLYDAKVRKFIGIGCKATGWVHDDRMSAYDLWTHSKNSVTLDMDLLNLYLSETTASIHYHPVKGNPEYMRARATDDYKVLRAGIELFKAEQALPRTDDFDKILKELRMTRLGRIHKFYHGSLGGVTEYYLTEKGREHFLIGNDNDMYSIYGDLKLPKADDAEKALGKAFAKSSNDLFKIRYITYNQLRADGLK